MKLAAILIVSIMLSGCIPNAVKSILPIPIQPKQIKVEEEPQLPIRSINVNSSPSEVTKAYVQTVYIQQSYIKYLRSLLAH